MGRYLLDRNMATVCHVVGPIHKRAAIKRCVDVSHPIQDDNDDELLRRRWFPFIILSADLNDMIAAYRSGGERLHKAHGPMRYQRSV